MAKRLASADLTRAEREHLDDVISTLLNELHYSKLVERIAEVDQERTSSSLDGKRKRASAWLEAVDVGEACGKLQDPEAFFLRVYAVEQVHEERMIDGDYSSELADVSAAIREIERAHGLSDDEYWSIGEGPAEWEVLCKTHDELTAREFIRELQTFGLKVEAELREREPKQFDRRRELGRRAMNGEITEMERLEVCQAIFEDEANRCAEVGSFHAAAVTIGAAIEAALLARCLQSEEQATACAKQLPRPRPGSDVRRWSLSDLARVATTAGWLPDFQIDAGSLQSEFLVHRANELRNMIHPARPLHSRLTNRVVQETYKSARATYGLIKRHLRA